MPFDLPPLLKLAPPSFRHPERVPLTASRQVVRSGNIYVDCTVKFATVGGTAKAGQDYTPVKGVLKFAAGSTSREIEVPPLRRDECPHVVRMNVLMWSG